MSVIPMKYGYTNEYSILIFDGLTGDVALVCV